MLPVGWGLLIDSETSSNGDLMPLHFSRTRFPLDFALCGNANDSYCRNFIFNGSVSFDPYFPAPLSAAWSVAPVF
jgi:hypothetical protein